MNVQLIDAETGNQLWAESFEKPVADLFEMQDEIVSRLANTLELPNSIAAEARRAERSPHPDAMDLCFQGGAWPNKGLTPENMAQARGSLNGPWRSIRETLRRWSAQRWSILQLASTFCTDDRAEHLTAAEAAFTKALSFAPNHPIAHDVMGLVKIFTNRAAQGIAECERALTLDRNLARAHANIGIAKFYLGRGGETEAHMEQALCLSPRDNSSISGVCLSVSPNLAGRRRRSDCLAAPEPRGQPKLSHCAFQSRGRFGARR